MRKHLALAVLMLVASLGAFGQPYDPNPTDGPTTLSNYESCDISTSPAATLLLPYFEVDPSGLGENTLIAVTNVSDTAIVAHVTVWTNWSFPVLDFNLYLTGYDVVTMSLRDLLVNGDIPNTSYDGEDSAPYVDFGTSCDDPQGGVGAVPSFLLTQIQSALTGGPYAAGAFSCSQVGSDSDNMIGYMTIDTSTVCSTTLPIDPDYYDTEIRWENQLIGDYIRLNDAEGVAGGNPLVHIKALPGGDDAPVTEIPRTFYNRYQTGIGVADRRQPLPSLFAGRYIEAGTAFDTNYVIWREGFTDETAACGDYDDNSNFAYTEFVRFDESENSTTAAGGCRVSPCQDPDGLSETQLININNTSYMPLDPNDDEDGGWVYFNLQHGNWSTPSQNWVQIRMTGVGLYGVDFDAAYLGNGCSTYTVASGAAIGPVYDGNTGVLWSGN